MSETDIYKKREESPQTGNNPHSRKSRRRRRSTGLRSFDESDRRRRSKNSGLRRLLHLSRKSENEKFFWWSMLAGALVLLALVAVWQFWYLNKVAHDRSKERDMRIPVHHIEPSNLPAKESP